MEVRGRLQAGGRGSRSVGQRRVRRRFRRRRPPRSLRHQLGPECVVPQPWRRHVRECGCPRRRRGWRLEHRLHVLRCRRRRRSRPLRRAIRRDDVGVRRAERCGRSSGATGHTSWSGRPDFPESPICSSKTSATDGSWRPPTRTASRTTPGPTASASWRPITTTTGSSTCSSRTTRTRISCITTSATATSKTSD